LSKRFWQEDLVLFVCSHDQGVHVLAELVPVVGAQVRRLQDRGLDEGRAHADEPDAAFGKVKVVAQISGKRVFA
jgi:hypothetical protein